MKLVCIVFAVLILLCGCSSPETEDSSSGLDYATQMLEYQNADGATFSLGGEKKQLKLGDSLSGFKLTRLLSRTAEDGFLNLRADFSCKTDISGTLKYNKSNTYKNMLQFFPDNPALFPRAEGDVEPLKWVVVRNEGDPLAALGLEKSDVYEKKLTITVVGFSTHYMQHSTINYITVEIKK